MTDTTSDDLCWSDLVAQWAVDRNLVDGSNERAQLGKLIEEVSELQIASNGQNIKKTMDAIGDCSVVLRIMALQLSIPWDSLPNDSFRIELTPIVYVLDSVSRLAKNIYAGRDCTSAIAVCMDALAYAAEQLEIDMDEAMAAAWDQIKDRKGRMVDGVFVKEEDLATSA